MNYTNNISIYKHTVNYCNKEIFPVDDPVKYDYRSIDLTDDVIFGRFGQYDRPVVVAVLNIDSFDLARQMNRSTQTNNILVLNLASDKNSGGGVIRGANAQEEDLYRKSNYFQANDPKFYPLGVTESVYSPLVHIIKDSNYTLLPEPVAVSCLAVAAINRPKLITLNTNLDSNSDSDSDTNTYANVTDRILTQKKIDSIFKIAIVNNHTELVLGALGCGAFRNPPKEVATMFKKSLRKYGRFFNRIGFAILCTNNTINYDTFKAVLSAK